MSLSTYPVRTSNPELVAYVVRLQGNTTSDPTLAEPESSGGITAARSTTGVYTLTWTDDPGSYVGAVASLEDTTPANVHDHQVTFDAYASKVLTLTLTDQNGGTPQLVDAATTMYLNLVVFFKRTSL